MLKERKTKENLRSRFPVNRKPYTIDYDYEDDSDLEGGEEDIPDDELIVTPQVAMEKLTDDSESVVVEKPDSKGGNESSDIISISDLDSLSSEPPDEKGVMKPISSAHTGTVVVIEDVAFITWVTFRSFDKPRTENRGYGLDFRHSFVTCTQTRLNSHHGGLWKDVRLALSRPHPNRMGFLNRHPNLSTDLPTR